ncbi:hypothetical protein E3N88_13636 [Mikania micrantha]|uniref:Pierisin-like domain-containing protein n=1 Tax=Mikania micrantha TaxID=192012 RepID=A0A5N6P1R4_9ASTR|nr:hypothetical protein E3N88_13636 [Mikania micrantha]
MQRRSENGRRGERSEASKRNTLAISCISLVYLYASGCCALLFIIWKIYSASHVDGISLKSKIQKEKLYPKYYDTEKLCCTSNMTWYQFGRDQYGMNSTEMEPRWSRRRWGEMKRFTEKRFTVVRRCITCRGVRRFEAAALWMSKGANNGEGWMGRQENVSDEVYCNLEQYVNAGGRPLDSTRPARHCFVSTTLDSGWYPPVRPEQGAVVVTRYEIYAPGGIWVAETLGGRYRYPAQDEVAFVYGIAPQYIRSAQLFRLQASGR